MRIPDHYLEDRFMEHVGFPVKRANGDMVGCCPFCMEGKSWGKKKRFNLFADKQALVCFNCGETHNAISFIKKVDNVSFPELMRSIGDEEFEFMTNKKKFVVVQEEKPSIDLPKDYINLFDKSQQTFYNDDYHFQNALQEVKRRRLNRAVNRGELWYSTNDWLHKERIIIPFFDEQDNLEFYQSRALNKEQEKEYGKYISSLNGEKIFWGMNQIQPDARNIFMFEGPLDAFFVKNSFGGGGTKLNTTQKNVLDDLEIMYDVIFCLDNDFGNKEVVRLYEEYIKKGRKMFMWGGSFSSVKDINEYCIDNSLDEVTEGEILKYVYSGEEAMSKLIEKVKKKHFNKKAAPKNEDCSDVYGYLPDVEII